MRRMTTARRGGFTLIELLVVVSIIALLAAIGTAAYLRSRSGAEKSATEATLQKLKSGMDKRWKAVLDDAADDVTKGRVPAAVLTFAANDKDRAKAIWTYCKLKNEFPTTVSEACNPVSVPVFDYTSNTLAGTQAVLPAKSVFMAGFKVPAGATAVASAAPADVQSAACFHWALTATATRGETFGADGTAQQTGDAEAMTITHATPNGSLSFTPRVFKDSWGNPISFVRQNYADELSNLSLGYTKAPLRDPLDPQARLMAFTPGGWSQQAQDAFWTVLNATPHVGLASTSASLTADFATYPRQGTSPNFTPRNWVPTLVSAGSNKELWRKSGANYGADDDLFSFRLARDSKGD